MNGKLLDIQLYGQTILVNEAKALAVDIPASQGLSIVSMEFCFRQRLDGSLTESQEAKPQASATEDRLKFQLHACFE
jgi:hypothetical protein